MLTNLSKNVKSIGCFLQSFISRQNGDCDTDYTVRFIEREIKRHEPGIPTFPKEAVINIGRIVVTPNDNQSKLHLQRQDTTFIIRFQLRNEPNRDIIL